MTDFPGGRRLHSQCILAAIVRARVTRRGGEVRREMCGATLEELESGEQGVDKT